MKDELKLSPASMNIEVAAIKTFLDMNDYLNINWRKVKKYVGEFYRVVDDRAYTGEEIKILVDNAHSLRDKAIILLLASTGMRRGAIPNLRIKHVKPIETYNMFSIDVYKHTKEQYYTFCTPECRKAIVEYVEWRERLGEKVTDDSPLFRESFDTRFGVRSNIKPIGDEAIRNMIKILRNETGVVPKQHLIENIRRGSQRTEIASSHGFRKFAITQMIKAKVDYDTREYLVGHKHSVGLDQSYDRTTVEDRLKEYVKAIDLLTINEENRLRRQVEELTIDVSKFDALAREIAEVKKMVTSSS